MVSRRMFVMRGILIPVALCSGWLPAPILWGGDTYTTRETAGAIYDLQGEYLGVIEAWGGTWGAQVIARSKEDLQVHLLEGGLPGDGYRERKPTKACSAKISGDRARGSENDFSVEVNETELSVFDPDSKKIGTLTKLYRESPTLGLLPPQSAIVLFNGENADNFQDGKMFDDQFLAVGCISKQSFQAHRLHLEFRTPFQPSDSGQDRGNSGVYIQGRYELQVLDSFGLTGENNECGGIYQIAQPLVNMCYPPLSWQTYDIDFKPPSFASDGKKVENARLTVRHNGVLIHDDLELPRGTPGGVSGESSEPGPLKLQNHSNPVTFRNIWVLPLE